MQSEYGKPTHAQRAFLNLVDNSTKILAMDGCLDQSRLEVLEKYTKKKAHLIHNTHKSRRGCEFMHTTNLKATKDYVKTLLAFGEHVICPVMRKELAEQFIRR